MLLEEWVPTESLSWGQEHLGQACGDPGPGSRQGPSLLRVS